MVLVPLLGWAGVSAYPARGILFGLSLPPIAPVNESLAKVLLALHGWAALAWPAHRGAFRGRDDAYDREEGWCRAPDDARRVRSERSAHPLVEPALLPEPFALGLKARADVDRQSIHPRVAPEDATAAPPGLLDQRGEKPGADALALPGRKRCEFAQLNLLALDKKLATQTSCSPQHGPMRAFRIILDAHGVDRLARP